jgi:hypothetical protein
MLQEARGCPTQNEASGFFIPRSERMPNASSESRMQYTTIKYNNQNITYIHTWTTAKHIQPTPIFLQSRVSLRIIFKDERARAPLSSIISLRCSSLMHASAAHTLPYVATTAV